MSRYIEEVQLINFQDHADTTITFKEGINLIVGSSDAGKSAILRAINYVFHNNLKGDGFIRVGCNECKVRIKFSDGIEVTRIRAEDTNSYVLKDEEGDYHTFSKVGTSVPEKITKALGSPPLDDKKRPISYSDQMSSLFLVDLSPTDLPRTLSELTGIENLQSAAEILQKNTRSFDRSIKDKSDKIEKLNQELSEYGYVDGDLEKITEIETKLKTIENKNSNVKSARKYIVDNNNIAQEANKIKKLLSNDKKIIALKTDFDSTETKFKSWSKSKVYLQTYATLIKEFKKKKTELDSLNQFLSKDNIDSFNSVKTKSLKVASAINYNFNNTSLTNKIENFTNLIETEKNNIDDLKKELERIKKELQTNGNWCDACDRPLI